MQKNDNSAAHKRMGRISYLNVLPIYHAMESGHIPHTYKLVYGPPATLNNLMADGGMLAASTSCIEYARRPERYFLLRDLAIGSKGAVQSVLLLSRIPIEELDGKEILVSAETHTSAALLRLIMKDHYNFSINWKVGSASKMVATGNPPTAFLAIGDEALRLRKHPTYPHALDLGDAWMNWTGLPFIFGVWVADKKLWFEAGKQGLELEHPGELLSRSRDWGMKNLPLILEIASQNYPNMTMPELEDYFINGLSYDLGSWEQQGMRTFWEKLASAGEIPAVPDMIFL